MTVEKGSYRMASQSPTLGVLNSGTEYRIFPASANVRYQKLIIKTISISGSALAGAGGGTANYAIRWSGEEAETNRTICACGGGGGANEFYAFQGLWTWGDRGIEIPAPRYIAIEPSVVTSTIAGGQAVIHGWIVEGEDLVVEDWTPVVINPGPLDKIFNFGGVKIP